MVLLIFIFVGAEHPRLLGERDNTAEGKRVQAGKGTVLVQRTKGGLGYGSA